MKNILYIIAGLLVAVWAFIFFKFNANPIVHLLLVFSAFIFAYRIVLRKQL